jgi:hypothetical protein
MSSDVHAEDENIIKGDNQGAIALASNPEYHARMKHIDIQYHFIHEMVENRQNHTSILSHRGHDLQMHSQRHWQRKDTRN